MKTLKLRKPKADSSWFEKHLQIERNFLPTGWEKLDNLIDGLYRQSITIIAGRPGDGKTTADLNLVSKMSDCRHYVCPTENSRGRWMEKLLSRTSGVPDKDIRLHPPGLVEKMRGDISELMARPIRVLDMYKPTFEIMEKDLAEFRPDVWHVDYFQNTYTTEPGYRGFTMAVERYHDLAIKYNCALVLMSQLRRGKVDEEKGPKRPSMDQLKETGKLEEAAKTIILLHRNGSKTEFIVEKNRDGETGIVSMKCNFAINELEEAI